MNILGIDIGGSGIKAAVVNTKTGELITERHRIDTPKPATPKTVAKVIKEIIDHFNWKTAVGCTFPTIIVNGKCMHSGNFGERWVGVQADQLFSETCNNIPFFVSNDADLAGVAEMNLGAGKGIKGKVFVITIGTGIGSGLFYDGKLIPNVELGHAFHKNGKIMEKVCADSVRKKDDLTFKEWAKRFDYFLTHVNTLHTPDLFILGGGISKKFDKFKEHLSVNVPIKAAKFRNNAGIIGAAMFAKENNK
jgi:polyphosphate glucokinase